MGEAKLTENERRALAMCAGQESTRGGINGALSACPELVRRGYLRATSEAWFGYVITPAGRAALAGDHDEEPTP